MKIVNILNFIKKDYLNKKNLFFKIESRNMKISSKMIGIKLCVYNGKYYVPFKVNDKMIDRAVGSFSFSKNILISNFNKYLKKKKNKLKKK